MKFIQASQVNKEQLEQFIENNDQIEIHSLLKTGYVVEYNEKIIGCFEMQSIDNNVYWLKQLYIIRNEAVKLPVLLEYILTFAKKQKAKIIYAHSEQPVTDLLLKSLRFSLQAEQDFEVEEPMKRKGHWWSYEVS